VECKQYTFKTDYGDGLFDTATLNFARPSADAKNVALSCLRSNQALQVDTARGDPVCEETRFADIVKDIWWGMEQGQDECSSDITGRRHEKEGALFGYSLNEAIWGPQIHLCSLEVEDSIKAWKPLTQVKSPHVIFCQRIGPVITCALARTGSCFGRQTNRGILNCLLQDLNQFYGERWGSQAISENYLKTSPMPRLPIGDEFEWIPNGFPVTQAVESHNLLGGPCACSGIENLQLISQKPTKSVPVKKCQRTENQKHNEFDWSSWMSNPIALRFGSVSK